MDAKELWKTIKENKWTIWKYFKAIYWTTIFSISTAFILILVLTLII